MIDIDVLTWTQQWEYWLLSRILNPLYFQPNFRWDYLLVPDQVWLGVGLYRAIRHLFVGVSGSVWDRLGSLFETMRKDPIIFLAFGLIFISEPQIFLRNRLRRRFRGDADQEPIDPEDFDNELIVEEDQERTLNPQFANEVELAQAGNAVVLPASVLRPCRNCHSDKAVATNIILSCGHFPFCDKCAKNNCSVCNSKGLAEPTSGQSVYSSMTSTELAKPPTVIEVTSAGASATRPCAVCQDREGLLTLVPCGHLLFCGPCVLGFRRCPFCSSRIARAKRGYDVRHNEAVS